MSGLCPYSDSGALSPKWPHSKGALVCLDKNSVQCLPGTLILCAHWMLQFCPNGVKLHYFSASRRRFGKNFHDYSAYKVIQLIYGVYCFLREHDLANDSAVSIQGILPKRNF